MVNWKMGGFSLLISTKLTGHKVLISLHPAIQVNLVQKQFQRFFFVACVCQHDLAPA
jgi:hypothetical protein